MGVCSLDDLLFADVDVRLEDLEFTAETLVVVAAARGPPPRLSTVGQFPMSRGFVTG